MTDTRSTKLFHYNQRNKHDPSVIFYEIEQIYTTAKSGVNGDWQCVCSNKNVFNALGFEVSYL